MRVCYGISLLLLLKSSSKAVSIYASTSDQFQLDQIHHSFKTRDKCHYNTNKGGICCPKIDSRRKIKRITMVDKNAFQWDGYRPLVDRIPACTAWGGGLPSGSVCPWGVSDHGGCLPRDVSAQRGVSQHAIEHTLPMWTDRHL